MGFVEAFFDFGADADFFDEFSLREEEIQQEAVLVAIDIVQDGNQSGVVDASVADEAANVGEVFLLNASLIVFVIGAATGEFHGEDAGIPGMFQMSEDVFVEEFHAVIGVKAPHEKRKFELNIAKGVDHARRFLVPDGVAFSPTAEMIG